MRISRYIATVFLTLGLAGATLANPTGPTVRHGQVNFSGGTQAQIQQLTDRAIVDWQSFSIGSGESVQFLQPSDLAVILNRVTGDDPSSILGRMTSNGNVFLINPNGILFGPDSVVNVGGLVASTLNITDNDFLSGNYSFSALNGETLGAVVNQGRIRVTDGGYAVLMGPAVFNEGTIIARSGSVALAAGEKATLNLDGRDLVHFALDSHVAEGTVLLAPGMMSDAIAGTLGVKRFERADRLVQMSDGSFRIASSSGTLVQSGLVSTDGEAFNMAAGAAVNAQSTEPEGPVVVDVVVEGEGSIVVDIVLFPEEEVPGAVFAQNNVYLVEEFLDDLIDPDSILEAVTDPTSAPIIWFEDGQFLQNKWRN